MDRTTQKILTFIGFTFFIVMFGLGITACGKKDKGGSRIGGPGTSPNCVNCPVNGGQYLTQGFGRNSDKLCSI